MNKTVDSSFGTNFFEYSVKKKPDKKTKSRKLVFISGVLALWIVFTVLSFMVMNGVAAVFVPISLLLCVILLWFLWRYTNLEYDYEISSGEMTMSVVYGGRSRKTLFSKKISEMDVIAKLNVRDKDELIKKADAVCECISSFSADELYYLIFTENNKKTLVFFETQKKGEKLFKFYNSSAARL